MVGLLGVAAKLRGTRLVAGRLVALLAATGLVACASPPPSPSSVLTDGTYVMGTLLELNVVAADPDAGRAAMQAGFALAKELDRLLSRYDERSDTRRLRREAGGELLVIDPRTAAILELAVEYARLTRGCFDVTVGPLVELWVEASRANRLPDEQEIEQALARVGATRIELEGDYRARLPEAGMSVDLGGVAKGYALDLMLGRLRDGGVEAALLSFGRSSVWATGAPPDAPGWRLLLEGPDGRYQGVVTLRDQAFSVSSTFGKSSLIAGRSFGHVIDPRSGWPVERRRLAAVVTRDASLAEALSTALVILGLEDGLALVESLEQVEAFMIEEGGRREQSRGWRRATRYEDLAGVRTSD